MPMAERFPGILGGRADTPHTLQGCGGFLPVLDDQGVVEVENGCRCLGDSQGVEQSCCRPGLVYVASVSVGADALTLPAAVRWMKEFSRLSGTSLPRGVEG